ncbi:helix-turn-helix domain-containing protein [Halobaculum sp. MBLA0143]|uniref:HVO_A0114 family putative DNA-binding protein n=1 Tax=Halobaculum sp. MBLA0143 TaxID=3079933 RepID=UPI003525AE4C
MPDPTTFDPDDADTDARLERRAVVSQALAEHGLTDTLVVSRERAEDLFHDRRLAIVDHLAEAEPRSVRALADELDLDKAVVSRDLQRLARIDVVEYVEQGRAKAPRLKHEHVVVEPVV